jgi:hypothetical protein
MNAGERFWMEVAALLRGWESETVRRTTLRDMMAIDTCSLAAGTQDHTHMVFAARSLAMALATAIPEARLDLVEALQAIARAAKATPVRSWRAGDPSDARRYWLD